MGNGRTYVLILFVWAALMIVTPILIRMSASAKLEARFNGDQRAGMKLLLPRRALVMAAEALSPSPTSTPLSAARGYSKLPLTEMIIDASEHVNSAVSGGEES